MLKKRPFMKKISFAARRDPSVSAKKFTFKQMKRRCRSQVRGLVELVRKHALAFDRTADDDGVRFSSLSALSFG